MKHSLRELLGLRRRVKYVPIPQPSPKVQVQVPSMGNGPMDEMYVATVHQDDGNETLLLWTLMQRASDGHDYPALIPIIAKTAEDMEAMVSFIKASCDIEAMPGANEDISIRRYGPWEHIEWVRQGAEPRW